MLDIKLIRKDPEKIKNLVDSKLEKCNISEVIELDKQKREKLTEVEELKCQRNKENDAISKARKAGEDFSDIIKRVGSISEEIKGLDVEISEVTKKLNDLLLRIPNIPQEDIPVGTEENNKMLRTWGEPRTYDFKPKPHWDIGADLQILEIERAAKLAGTGFSMLSGKGAKLERALINFMLDTHEKNGYKEVAPPYMANRQTMQATGQLPKLENDMYYANKDEFFLIPTSEVPLVNFYRNETLQTEKLPIYFMGATPCFRREAGAAGKDTRGLLRVHQFNKVELIHFVKPEASNESLELLLSHAEGILQKLGLHYRVVLLATGDMSFASNKTYDIEVWAPGVEKWLEVSSCSNCTDFQARRAGIKHKAKKQKAQFVHTLNGSGVATPRLMVALLETYQQADGHVKIPQALIPYMGGLEII